MGREPLSAEELTKALASLEGWQLAEDGAAIAKHFIFRDFNEAFAFMTEVAKAAEALNHHPDWSNSYKHVRVMLSTHDAGGVTDKDIRLARFMDEAAAARISPR